MTPDPPSASAAVPPGSPPGFPPAFPLAAADRAFLQRVHGGLTLMLRGLALCTGSLVVAFVAAACLRTWGTPVVQAIFFWAVVALVLVALGGSVAVSVGVGRATAVDPRVPIGAGPASVAWATRWASIVTTVGGALVLLLAARFDGDVLMLWYVAPIVIAADMARLVGLLRWSEWMARRAGDEALAVDCVRSLVLIPAIALGGAMLLLIGPVIAVVRLGTIVARVRRRVGEALAAGGSTPSAVVHSVS